jgi:hypothetical protein
LRSLALATLAAPAAGSDRAHHRQDGEFSFRSACGGPDGPVTARYVENVDRSPDTGFQVYEREPFTLRVHDEGAFDHVVVYFTTDGSEPSGAFGRGFGSTQVARARRAPTARPARTPCRENGPATATLPGQGAGTHVAYTVGAWSEAEDVEERSDGGAFAYEVIAGAVTPLLIKEFRLRGPGGVADEFIEIYNSSNTSHTVMASDGAFYTLVASDGVPRCFIPNGTVLPARSSYLCVNSLGYGLALYPGGPGGGVAAGNALFANDIPDNAGLALFQSSTAVSFTLANRIDAVGSTTEANTLYKEGTGYPALPSTNLSHAFYRDDCGKQGSIPAMGTCPNRGLPSDTDDNATDFVYVETNGTATPAGQRLGAPGPQNQASPRFGENDLLPSALLDTCVPLRSPPNQARDFTSDPPNSSTFGTVEIRRTFTNNTGADITRLRFRVVDLTTFPAPGGLADLRPRTTVNLVATVDRPPCGSGTSNVTVVGTTLETPPTQVNGGGFGSSLSVPSVALGAPLAAGASINVRFLFGIQQSGRFKLGLIPETSPNPAGPLLEIPCANRAAGDLVFADGFDCDINTH